MGSGITHAEATVRPRQFSEIKGQINRVQVVKQAFSYEVKVIDETKGQD